MDGVNVRDFGSANNAVDPQVALAARAFAYTDGFISELNVHRIGVSLGIDGHGANVQLLAGADNANGDFSPVRYQDLLKHGVRNRGF
jgi:hypothetical protein